MNTISKALLSLLLAFPLFGACRSANVINSYLDSGVVTSWYDASGLDWVVGWHQNSADIATNESFFILWAGTGETEASNAAMFIFNSASGKQGMHEYSTGTNEGTAVDDFCSSNSCSATSPNYYTIVAEKVSSTKTYKVDWALQDVIDDEGHDAWNETFSQTYTNEHTGGTDGLKISIVWPQNAGMADIWFWRGTMPDMHQRAASIGAFRWDSHRFFFTPCRNDVADNKIMNFGAIPITWSDVGSGMVESNVPPAATLLPFWMMQ